MKKASRLLKGPKSKLGLTLIIAVVLTALILVNWAQTGDKIETTVCKAKLTEVVNFGSNPGNLRMYKYIPKDMPDNAPLVVSLHGCLQDANEYAGNTGWNKLADRWKFYVIYAQQKLTNNVTFCFNWFNPVNSDRGRGEALSIKQMVDKMMVDYSINKHRVYVTGFSAGGYMTAVMLAVYPEVFAGGAVMAGGPYKCATNIWEARYFCMLGKVDKTPQQWGDLVKNAFPYLGTYPILSIFHGNSDHIVDNLNMNELMEQWTNLHGADQIPEENEIFRGHRHKVYYDNKSRAIVETYHLNGLAHAISVDPGRGEDQGGTVGYYSKDKDIYSSYYAAKFWGLVKQVGSQDWLPHALEGLHLGHRQTRSFLYRP